MKSLRAELSKIDDLKKCLEPFVPEKIRKAATIQLELLSDLHFSGAVRYGASRARGVKAGTGLGYYPLRIFVHEHPIATAVITAAATSGLGYIIYQHLNK